MTLYEMLLYFFIYGILGWCTEVAFAAAKERRFVNRGFLNGPICPIYGVGVVTVTAFLDPLRDQWVLLYLASTILVTLIEGLTGFVLDRLFHHKWWDYTGMPFNIGGYVCLVFSLVWGVACVTIVKVIHPVVRDLCLLLPHVLGILILTGCVCAMAADLLVTVNSILKWNRQLDALDKIAADLRELSGRMGENIYENVMDGIEIHEKLDAAREERKEERKEQLTELRLQAEELRGRYRNWQREVSGTAGVSSGPSLPCSPGGIKNFWSVSGQESMKENSRRFPVKILALRKDFCIDKMQKSFYDKGTRLRKFFIHLFQWGFPQSRKFHSGFPKREEQHRRKGGRQVFFVYL